LELMLSARQAVQERFGVELVPEVELLGSLRSRWQDAVGSESAPTG